MLVKVTPTPRRLRSRSRLLVGAVLLALLASACGDGGDGTSTAGGAATTEVTQPPDTLPDSATTTTIATTTTASGRRSQTTTRSDNATTATTAKPPQASAQAGGPPGAAAQAASPAGAEGSPSPEQRPTQGGPVPPNQAGPRRPPIRMATSTTTSRPPDTRPDVTFATNTPECGIRRVRNIDKLEVRLVVKNIGDREASSISADFVSQSFSGRSDSVDIPAGHSRRITAVMANDVTGTYGGIPRNQNFRATLLTASGTDRDESNNSVGFGAEMPARSPGGADGSFTRIPCSWWQSYP